MNNAKTAKKVFVKNNEIYSCEYDSQVERHGVEIIRDGSGEDKTPYIHGKIHGIREMTTLNTRQSCTYENGVLHGPVMVNGRTVGYHIRGERANKLQYFIHKLRSRQK